MQHLLKIVGNGQRTMRDFTAAEAEAAMEVVLSGSASVSQIAALMAVLRIKEESTTELQTFTEVLRRYSQRLTTTHPHSIDICVPYDGRSKTPMLLVASGLIAASCGVYVGFHGRLGQTVPPKFGVGAGDVLEALGYPVHLTLDEAGTELAQTGIAFVDTAQFAPVLTRFDPIRLEYGMRSFFNTIEKLLNPFNASTALVGIFHYPVMRRVAQVIQTLDYERGLAIQGPEGSIEALVNRRTPIIEFKRNQPDLVEWVIDPHHFDWWENPPEITNAYTAQSQAELTLQILNPDIPVPDYYRRSVILTASMMLCASGKVESITDGVELARKTLTQGAALCVKQL